MNGSILTLNAGSSSLKFALFEADGEAPLEQARGQVGGLGTKPRMAIKDPHGGILEEQQWSSGEGPDSAQAALRHTLAWLEATYPRLRVVAVGHRVAHGGPEYSAPVVLDQGVITTLRQFNPLAPLHQGIDLDQNRNRRSDIVISSDRSRCRVFVIKTNEERMLAEHTLGLLRAQGQTNSLAENTA